MPEQLVLEINLDRINNVVADVLAIPEDPSGWCCDNCRRGAEGRLKRELPWVAEELQRIEQAIPKVEQSVRRRADWKAKRDLERLERVALIEALRSVISAYELPASTPRGPSTRLKAFRAAKALLKKVAP